MARVSKDDKGIMKQKLRVAWVCHLTNDSLNHFFQMDMNMCAYWMTQFIGLMKDHIEIHVVAPNYYTNKDITFELDGVHYHLFKYHSKFGDARVAFCEIAVRKEKNIKSKISNIIGTINPDVVHLFGAENITYSAGILPQIGVRPVLTSFQGYIQLAEQKGNLFRKLVIKQRAHTEDEILKKCPNVSFGTFEMTSEEYYKKKYGRGRILPINFPFKMPELDATKVFKEYDIVFWGRVTYEKGVEDLIEMVSLIKKQLPSVSCMILGGGSQEYFLRLKGMVEERQLKENVIFGGFQKTDRDLFENAAKAKVYVLPTHFDALPGSIRESMAMKLPVASYDVGDIPTLNKNRECVVLAKALDVNDLAVKVCKVLQDDDYREVLINNSYEEILNTSSDSIIVRQFMNAYEKILS